MSFDDDDDDDDKKHCTTMGGKRIHVYTRETRAVFTGGLVIGHRRPVFTWRVNRRP